MRLAIRRLIHRDRINTIRRAIRELMPAALDGNESAINTVSRLSNRLKRESQL